MSCMLRTPKHLWTFYCRSTILPEYIRSSCKLPFSVSKIKHRPSFALQTSSFNSSCHLFNTASEVHLDSSSSSSQRRENDLLKQLHTRLQKLEYDVQSKTRISQLEAERILSLVKTTGKVNGNDAFLLIRCCGSLIPEMQRDKRAQLVDDVWRSLQALKFPLDVSHYNALLKVYLENEYKFNPVEFLRTIEQQGLEPNRITYHRLISRYCQVGDIEGASKILEFMKTKEIPVNEDIFNELISGHANRNDMEGAKNIIDVMRNSQLVPGSSTYTAVACGYAKLGDIDSVLSTIQEASTQETYIEDRDLLKVIYTLTVNNHGHLVEKVLPHMRYRPGYNNECVNVCLELVNRGFHEVAFSLIKTMPRKIMPDGTLAPGGMFFIRQLVKENQPEDVIIEYCNKMREHELNEDALLEATEKAFSFSKIDMALSLLKELHLKGFELRPHYFWPILASKKGSDEDLYGTLKLMLDLNCQADYDTFTDYVFPLLSSHDLTTSFTKLTDIGYNIKDAVEARVGFVLQNCDTRDAAELLEKYVIKVHSPAIIARLARSYIVSQDVSSTMKVLQHCQDNSSGSENENDVYEEFLIKLVKSPNFSVPLLKPVIKALKEKDVKISRSVAETVSENLWPRDDTSLLSMLDTIVCPESTFEDSKPRVQDGLSKGRTTVEDLHNLLLTQSREKNVDGSEMLLKELDRSNFIYPGRTYNSLIEMYCYHGDLDKASYFKNKLDSSYPDYLIFDHTVINMASVMVCNKKYDDAMSLIKNHHSKFGGPGQAKLLSGNALRLLNSCANSEDPERTRDAFQMLVDLGYCTPTNALLTPLVKAYLNKNDTNGAVEEYLRIIQTYGLTPIMYQMLKHLVELADTENLQKVIDASIQVHEESSVLLNLACVFLDCGQQKQAKKVLETPGLRLRMEKVQYTCENYLARNMVNELEQLLQITKGVFGLDRQCMYYHLLKGYVNAQNVEKALGVWVKLQEEDLSSSNRTLHLLGTFLQQMNQPVPFTIPPNPDDDIYGTQEMDRKERQKRGQRSKAKALMTVRANSTNIGQLVNEKKLDEALNLTMKILDYGKYPAVNVLRHLAFSLTESGDTTALLNLQQKLPEELAMQVRFRDYVVIAGIKKGQTEEFLTSLETEVFKYNGNFPGGAFLRLLDVEPNVLDRVRKMVDVYYKEGDVFPKNLLWIHLMTKKMFQEADQILQSTPEMQSTLLFRKVLQVIRQNKDVELSHMLLDVIRELPLTEKAKGQVYSSHIDLLRSINKFEEALQFIRELQKSFSLEKLQPNVLMWLQKDLANANMTLPLDLSLAAGQASSSLSTSRKASSSSSESSDSD